MDGNCSGAIVYSYHKKKGETVRCYSANHNIPVPLDKIKKDEKVYIVDFSLKEDIFNKLLEITKDVIWIDHHKSAIEKFKDTEVGNLDGIRRVGDAGCELTWEHFYGKNSKMPTIVRMLGRYDVWDFSLYGMRILNALQEFCKTVNTLPNSDIWEKWLDLDFSPKEELSDGAMYLQYRNSIWGNFLKSWGFDVDFEGYKAIACNTANVSSEFFRNVHGKDYDIFMPFIYDGENWVVSLYTLKDNIDCSKIAVKYGGGGHRKAAGFTTKNLPFISK